MKPHGRPCRSERLNSPPRYGERIACSGCVHNCPVICCSHVSITIFDADIDWTACHVPSRSAGKASNLLGLDPPFCLGGMAIDSLVLHLQMQRAATAVLF